MSASSWASVEAERVGLRVRAAWVCAWVGVDGVVGVVGVVGAVGSGWGLRSKRRQRRAEEGGDALCAFFVVFLVWLVPFSSDPVDFFLPKKGMAVFTSTCGDLVGDV